MRNPLADGEAQSLDDVAGDGALSTPGIAKESRHLLVLRFVTKPMHDAFHRGMLLWR